MKVLLGHNFYRSSSPSGEDSVYRNERQLLERHVEVIPYERYNDDIDETTLNKKIQLAFAGAWSSKTYRDISKIIGSKKPDIAHFHNTFPLISPSAYAACRDNDVPVIQTLHNYRLICPNAMLLRRQRPCEDCVKGNLVYSLIYRCYRGSLPATAALVLMLVSNRLRGTYKQLVNRYIALTSFAASKMIEGGLPAESIEIKPNFLPHKPQAGGGVGDYAVFVGRLSIEKGLRTLLDAWTHLPNFKLKVIGDGPLRNELHQKAQRSKISVEFLGFQGQKEILSIVRDAKFVVVPSECYEGFPMVILEAYACGTPVVASKIGSLEEIVTEERTGFLFEPGKASDLSKIAKRIFTGSVNLKTMRTNAREEYLRKYTAEIGYDRLSQIYTQTLQHHWSGNR